MKRVSYVDLLESLRAREHGTDVETLATRVQGSRRRDATRSIDVRMTPEQRAFLKQAAKRAPAKVVDESAIVSVAVSIVEALDIPWEAMSSRDIFVDAVRRRLRSR